MDSDRTTDRLGGQEGSMAAIRIGAVTYLNTKPLVYQLEQLLPEAQLQFDLPSRLADRLAAGELDVALVPIFETFLHPEWRRVSDACIACRGPVLSVKLLLRTRPERIERVALDEGSRTSAALVRVVLARRVGINPEFEPLPLGQTARETMADAVLVIGDRAIAEPADGWFDVWDLGDVWNRWAELPFVFAAWMARPGVDVKAVAEALGEARDRGVADAEALAREFTGYQGLGYDQCLSYLRDHLYFYLGERERRGLERFRQLSAALGLLEPALGR